MKLKSDREIIDSVRKEYEKSKKRWKDDFHSICCDDCQSYAEWEFLSYICEEDEEKQEPKDLATKHLGEIPKFTFSSENSLLRRARNCEVFPREMFENLDDEKISFAKENLIGGKNDR